MQKQSELEIIAAGEKVLLEQLGPVNATRFWLALTAGQSDYLNIKDRLFKDEIVDSLYAKITAQRNQGS